MKKYIHKAVQSSSRIVSDFTYWNGETVHNPLEDRVDELTELLQTKLKQAGILDYCETYEVYVEYGTARTVSILIQLDREHAYREFSGTAYPKKFDMKVSKMIDDIEAYIAQLDDNEYSIATVNIDGHLLGYVADTHATMSRGYHASTFITSDPKYCTKRAPKKIHLNFTLPEDGDNYDGLKYIRVWDPANLTEEPKQDGSLDLAFLIELDSNTVQIDLEYVDIRDAELIDAATTRATVEYLRSIAFDWIAL